MSGNTFREPDYMRGLPDKIRLIVGWEARIVGFKTPSTRHFSSPCFVFRHTLETASRGHMVGCRVK